MSRKPKKPNTHRRTLKESGKIDFDKHPKGPNGRALCRWCLLENKSIEVPPGRKSFCNDKCAHEWMLRSDPSYVREMVFKRDHGVCSKCQTDIVEYEKKIKVIAGMIQKFIFVFPEVAESDVEIQERFRKVVILRETLRILLLNMGLSTLPKRSLWEADHKLAVANGGGCLGLDNYQTLCKKCHVRKSVAENRARKGS